MESVMIGRSPGFPTFQASLVLRNIGLNIAGSALPLVVGVLAIPVLIQELGAERFGILGILWAILAYAAISDLGVGRAATYFVARSLAGQQKGRIATVACLGVALAGSLGAVIGLLLAGASPTLVKLLRVPQSLVLETQRAFWALALALPLISVSSVLRGLLEAKHRFGLVNAVKAPTNAGLFALPALGALFGADLAAVVWLMVIPLAFSTTAYCFFCLRVLPELRQRPIITGGVVASLLSYGGWITLSNVIGPSLTYLDRLFLASFLGVAAVAYYVAPYEMVTRLWLIPWALAATVFPMFSATPHGLLPNMQLLYGKSIKFLILVLWPIISFVVVFAKDFLTLWLGIDIANHSTIALRLLAVGVFANGLAQVPHAYLQGSGRPDILAKLQLVQIVPYAIVAWHFIQWWGIAGAAGAWALRLGVEAGLLFALSAPLCYRRLRPLLLNRTAFVCAAWLLLLLAGQAIPSRLGMAVAIGGMLGPFGWFVWRHVIDKEDRTVITYSLFRSHGASA